MARQVELSILKKAGEYPQHAKILLRMLPSGPDLVQVFAFRGFPGKVILYTMAGLYEKKEFL